MTKRRWLVIVGLGVCVGSARAEDRNDDEDEPRFLASMPVTGAVSFDARKHRECKPLSFKAGDRTTIFTERPTRQAHSMATAEFVASWSDAYGAAGPNAHLYLFNRQGQSENAIVYLKSKPTWNEATKTIAFSDACFVAVNEDRHERKPHDQFEMGVLFIDGGKLFKWNSCYGTIQSTQHIGTTSNAGAVIYPWICVEQWGSYAATCNNSGDWWSGPTLVPGKRCKDTCKTSGCPGCFSNYKSSESWSHLGSTYMCK